MSFEKLQELATRTLGLVDQSLGDQVLVKSIRTLAGGVLRLAEEVQSLEKHNKQLLGQYRTAIQAAAQSQIPKSVDSAPKPLPVRKPPVRTPIVRSPVVRTPVVRTPQ